MPDENIIPIDAQKRNLSVASGIAASCQQKLAKAEAILNEVVDQTSKSRNADEVEELGGRLRRIARSLDTVRFNAKKAALAAENGNVVAAQTASAACGRALSRVRSASLGQPSIEVQNRHRF